MNNSFLLKLKKAPRVLYRIGKMMTLREMGEIVRNIKFSHLTKAISARSARRPHRAEFKKGLGTQEINDYLDSVAKYRKNRLKGDIYRWEMNNQVMHGNFLQFLGLREEYFCGVFATHYDFSWKDKVVLDLGGFIGDSARFFLSQEAKKVIIYEPVAINVQSLKYNLQDYSSRYEVYQNAVAARDGKVDLFSGEPQGSLGFGLNGKAHKIACAAISFQTLLQKHTPDVIKVDCEGAEIHLVTLAQEALRSVSYWIVETHRPDIYASVVKKFEASGFEVKKNFSLNDSVNLLHFKRVNNDQ